MEEFDMQERSGAFRVLGGTPRSQAASMVLGPGEATGGPENRHADSDQWLYVISGRCRAVVEGRTVTVEAGGLLLIEAGEAHEIQSAGNEPLRTLNVYAPPEY